jgi:uncharacterized membrane protein
MEHPATEPPAKQEGKRPSDADVLGYLTPTGARRHCAEPSILQALGCDGTLTWRAAGAVVGSVEIDWPASQVWAYMTDYGNDPSWRAAVTQMRPSVVGAASQPG